MSIQPTDIAIFLISFAACAYCIVLSRRLRALQNTKDGLGATIMAFSDSMSAMKSSTQKTRNHANELAAQLTALMNDAAKTCSKIDELTKDMEARHEKAAARVNTAHGELNKTMRGLIEESRSQMIEMNTLTRKIRVLTDGATAAIEEAINQSAIPPAAMTATQRTNQNHGI